MRNYEDATKTFDIHPEKRMKAVNGDNKLFVEESFKDSNGDTRYVPVYAPFSYEEAIAYLEANPERALALWTYSWARCAFGQNPMAWTLSYGN